MHAGLRPQSFSSADVSSLQTLVRRAGLQHSGDLASPGVAGSLGAAASTSARAYRRRWVMSWLQRS